MSIVGSASKSESFPRALRLLSAADFARLFQQSRRTGNRHFTVLVKPNSSSTARVGFAISRKAVKHAVKRNLIKRKIREMFRHQHRNLPPVDMIFIAKSSVADIDKIKLDRSLDVVWQRVISQCEAS